MFNSIIRIAVIKALLLAVSIVLLSSFSYGFDIALALTNFFYILILSVLSQIAIDVYYFYFKEKNLKKSSKMEKIK